MILATTAMTISFSEGNKHQAPAPPRYFTIQSKLSESSQSSLVQTEIPTLCTAKIMTIS